MHTTIKAAEIATRLLALRTNDDIEAILAEMPNAVWKPLGKAPNNYAQINVLIDPADALVERVTNGLDAVIERKVLEEKREDLQSPRQATEELFGVPGGHVYNLREDSNRRALAANVIVTLRESGASKAPTVVIEDHGIGQHPGDFESTLVSLNEDNKVKRLYLMGAFGWGGAAAYAFTDKYAAFFSRRDPTLLPQGQADEVGWTIVRYNAHDDDPTVKVGVYEYLCVDEGSTAPVIPHFPAVDLPTEQHGWVGTICTLVQYELVRYSDPIWRPRNSLWLMFNALLFDPVLPFLIRDERSNAIKGNEKSSLGGLVINGTAAKLAWDSEKKDEKKLIALSGGYTYRLPDSNGQALIRYFVVEGKGDAKADWEPTLTYVTPEQAVTVTHNGQRQGSFRRELFEKLGLMTLAKFLIVQVDCDALSWRAKRELFSSTRDRLKDSPLARTLREAVAEALQSDTILRQLDRQRKEAALARKSQAQAERIKKLLEKHIASLRQGQMTIFRKVISSNADLPILGDQPLLDEAPPAPTEKNSVETARVQYEGDPTALTVLNPTVQVRAGGKAVVRMALDATDNYVTAAGGGKGKFTPLVTKGSDMFRVVGNSDLRDGMMRCTISADAAKPGDRGRIVFTVSRPEALPLLAEADVVAIEPPQPRVKPAGKSTGQEQGPNVVPVAKEEWGVFGFDEKTVARVEENSPEPGLTTVYVNQDYPPFVARLMAEKKAPDKLDPYKEKFIAAMALHAWLQSEQQDSEQVVPREVLDAELRRSAEMFLFAQFTD